MEKSPTHIVKDGQGASISVADRELILNLSILKALLECGQHGLSEPTLHTTINVRVTPDPTIEEFQERLKWLQDRDYVDFKRPPLGGHRIWRVTTDGADELRNHFDS